MRRGLLHALVLLFVFALTVPAAAQVKLVTSGKRSRETTRKDWQRHANKGKYYTESWTVSARSKAGHIMLIQFLYSNIGVFSGSTAVNVSFAHPGKQGKHYVFEHTTKEWGEDAKTGRIGVGASWMAFDGKQAEIRVKEKGVTMKLAIAAWTPGVKLHDGTYRIDKEDKERFVQVFTHIPRGSIKGSVVIDGESVDFTGDAYVDHWAQTVLGTDYCHKMWTLRFFHQDYTVTVLLQQPQSRVGGEKLVQAVVTDRKGILSFGDRLEFRGRGAKQDPKGHAYDTEYEIRIGSAKSAVRVAGRVRKGRLWDRDAVLDQLNAAQKQVVKWVAGNPVIYRLEGAAELTLTIDGKEHKLTGPALMESLILGAE